MLIIFFTNRLLTAEVIIGSDHNQCLWFQWGSNGANTNITRAVIPEQGKTSPLYTESKSVYLHTGGKSKTVIGIIPSREPQLQNVN